MPKMKSSSGAKKRFKLTATGRIKRKKAFKSHIIEWGWGVPYYLQLQAIAGIMQRPF